MQDLGELNEKERPNGANFLLRKRFHSPFLINNFLKKKKFQVEKIKRAKESHFNGRITLG